MNDTRSASTLDHQLGRRVRIRRLEIGMSQEQLAALLGVTFQQVQKYEKGVNRIAASRLYDIATALKMSVCDFFDDLPSKSSPLRKKGIETALASRDGTRLVSLYASIGSLKLRRQIVDLVEALAQKSDE